MPPRSSDAEMPFFQTKSFTGLESSTAYFSVTSFKTSVRILNKARKTVISEDATEARSFLSRVRGLMLTKKPQTLVLVSPSESVESSSIHMWFMRQPIDVIWLDSGLKAVDLLEGARPWAFRVFRPKSPAKYVVECPVGVIKASGTKRGDSFSFLKD